MSRSGVRACAACARRKRACRCAPAGEAANAKESAAAQRKKRARAEAGAPAGPGHKRQRPGRGAGEMDARAAQAAYAAGGALSDDAESVHVPGEESDDALADYYDCGTSSCGEYVVVATDASESENGNNNADDEFLIDELAAEVSFVMPRGEGAPSKSGAHGADAPADATLVAHLAKMTPQILAAISVAARSLASRQGDATLTMEIDAPGPAGARAAPVTLALDDVMDTKKLAKILSTSPMPAPERPAAAVPLGAYRRSRRGSYTHAEAPLPCTALREQARADRVLLHSPRKDDVLVFVARGSEPESSSSAGWSSDEDCGLFGPAACAHADDIAAAMGSVW